MLVKFHSQVVVGAFRRDTPPWSPLKEAKLHKHAGATFVIVTSGSGTFRDENGVRVVRQGDMIYVPPDTPHLSIADKKTTMIEMVVYIGESGDMQASLSV